MANRLFNQYSKSLEKEVVHLFANVAIGVTGAPTLSALNSKGVSTIVRNSAGKYTITLQDFYSKVLFVGCANIAATIPAAPNFSVVSATASTGVIVIQFASGGLATDPANGESLLLNIVLGNTSIP